MTIIKLYDIRVHFQFPIVYFSIVWSVISTLLDTVLTFISFFLISGFF